MKDKGSSLLALYLASAIVAAGLALQVCFWGAVLYIVWTLVGKL